MEETENPIKEKSPDAYRGGGGGGHINPARDVRKSLSEKDLEIYNKFTHGKEHTLASVRQSRNKQAMLDALAQTRGYVGKACEMVGISRRTFYSYVSDDPLFAEMIMEIREANVDFAEDKLLTNIERGFEASIIFYLKTQGRRRGYSEGNVPGAFQGTQEEYYQNRFRDLDDTHLIEEIKILRERLKIGEDVSIGGFDGEELLDEQEFLEESQVVNVEEIPPPKDIIIEAKDVFVGLEKTGDWYEDNKEEQLSDIIKEKNTITGNLEEIRVLTPAERLDALLKDTEGKTAMQMKQEDYLTKRINPQK